MNAPTIKRGTLRNAVGLEVGTLSVTLGIDADTTIQGQPAAVFARRGGFDGARIEVRRYFARTWDSAACGSLHVFAGRVAEVPEISGTSIRLDAKDDRELLNVSIPRNVLSAQCRHTVYGPGCNVSAAAFTANTTAGVGSTAQSISTGLAAADGYYDLGVVVFTGGANAGIRRTIRSYAGGAIVPVYPFPYTPAPGDTLQARPGCDGTRATCAGRFANTDNHGGQTHIPAPEVLY